MSSSQSTIIIPSSKIPQTGKSTLRQQPSGASGSFSNTLTKSIYEKNLNRRAPDLSLSSFSFLFSEAIQYLQKQSSGIQDLEKK